MTDNDKAATFIGWEFGQRCHGTSYALPVSQKNYCGDTRWPHSSHDIPSPDMSDPRNYMKALENINHWYVSKTEPWHLIHNGHEVRQRGRTPVAALAALYDAEHAA